TGESMSIHPSRFEQMTALTDLFLGIFASYAVVKLIPLADFKSQVWRWAFALLAIASFLGALAHGIAMPQKTNARIWAPLNLSLGLALGLFVVGAVFDFSGEESARTILPIMLALGVIFFLVTIIFPDTFLTFIIYEGAAMLFALGVYVFLFYKNISPNAQWMALGVLITIVAAVVQAVGQAGKSMLWYFDNNGMFHLIQMIGLAFLFMGLGIL
ncbi:MAG: hypothetical protein PHQ36_08010, partial [Anaerolineales bacterium]|nr:hypothetical protein [Anaerolineales bacterium]